MGYWGMDTKFTLLIYDEFADEYRAALETKFPSVRILTATTLPEAERAVLQADGLASFAHGFSAELLARPRLKWFQFLGSGPDRVLKFLEHRKDIVLTTTRGAHAPMVSEMAILLMLAVSRDIRHLSNNQAVKGWDRRPGRLLYGKTAGIAGIGTIGLQIARKCKAFDMKVLGFGSARRTVPDVDEFFLYEALTEVAPQLDFLILVVPLRPDTERMIDKYVLAAMRPSSFLINVGRGKTVDDGALLECLRTRQIAGAGLDALAQEPLPPTSLLWSLENVVITPHIAGLVEEYRLVCSR